MNMEKIETKTQEVTLLVVVVAVLSVLFTGGIYLNLNEVQLTTLTGNVGLAMLDFMFSILGYATFFVALSILQIGKYLLKYVSTPRDMMKVYPRLALKFLSEAAIISLVASIFTVFESYFQFQTHVVLRNSSGGNIGQTIGGSLYTSFGIYGALVLLLVSLIITMVITGNLQLTTMYYAFREYSGKLIEKSLSATKESFSFLSNKSFKLVEGFLPESVLVPLYKSQIAPVIVSDRNEKVAASVEDFDLSQVPPAPVMNTQMSVVEASVVEVAKPVARSRSRVKKPAVEVFEENFTEPDVEVAKNIISQSYKKRYTSPSSSHLDASESTAVKKKADTEKSCQDLEERLKSFAIDGKVIDAYVGSRLTMFEFQPAPGIRLNKITGLSSDLALMLGAESIRILAPIPGKTTVGIEIPNKTPKMVKMGDMLKPLKKMGKTMNLPIAIGKDVYNNTIIQDIAKMPHMMVSGTTGSGKSVFINNLIVSLLYTQSPKKLRFLMIDPKMIELSPYNGIPHLLKPVVTDLDDAKDLLVWAAEEMDRRYKCFSDIGARDLNSFNDIISASEKKLHERKRKKSFDWNWEALPQIVIIVDELADLMITKGKEVEIPITRIAQKARAAGIHLIIATQRPSAEVVTGLIKTNFPTRVAFKVSSSIDSRTILDSTGAEKLLGNGDMLYMANGKSTERFQSAFISEEEVRKLVNEIQV